MEGQEISLTSQTGFGIIRSLLTALVKLIMRPDSGKSGSPNGDVTVLLRRWAAGESEACEQIVSLLYPELKKIAESRMRAERGDHTLQPTALISEFFLELARQREVTWENRAHFLAVASKAMRRLLIDHSRSHNAAKRGGGTAKVQLDGLTAPGNAGGIDILELNELLDRLAAEEPRMAQVVEMRCFGGLTYQEIGESIGVDERTAKRDWQVARAWLSGQLRKGRTGVSRAMGTDQDTL